MSLGSRYSQHSFAQVPSVHIPRSKFDRSFAIKDTYDFDYLWPIFVDEILPGDTINLNVKSFARLATQIVPVLDNMYIDFFFFFVPNRLVWTNWEKFNGAQEDPGDSTDYAIPTITINTGSGWPVGSLYDKFGLPTDVDDLTINALPLRGYNLIWNEWFRDQNLSQSVTVYKTDGPDDSGTYVPLKRAKKHDYFTSCLPWPQKGDAVDLPLGSKALVYLDQDSTDYQYFRDMSNNTLASVSGISSDGSARIATAAAAGQPARIDLGGTHYADLTNATAATINTFRQALQLQGMLELDARGGTRYTEILKAHFGVISPDFRLQRPELLSIGTTRIMQHPVAQTSESNTTKQANLAAFSTAANFDGKIGFSKSFVEHGYVIGLVCARGEVTYQQGINRLWSRSTRYDFFWPKLQQIGEQAVYNKEIYAQGTADDDLVFGYQERYAEYRYKPSEIRGQFRSTYSAPLDVWHLAEEFSSLPALNDTFIGLNTPVERCLAVAASYPHLLMDAWFDYRHARPMMTYGVPATLGRF